ncbi:hypothetical protein PIB30_096287, partial [Stylosanthes scabra]|nr:hypothetical protein [Stylosanthes scabra]
VDVPESEERSRSKSGSEEYAESFSNVRSLVGERKLLSNSIRRLTCHARRKVLSISGSNNNKSGVEVDLRIQQTIMRER